MLPLGYPTSTSWTGGTARGCAGRLVTRQPVYLGRYSTGRCGWDDSPPARTDQIIFPQLVEVLTLLESVSRVAFCRQCYLPGSACRCLGSCSTTSTASLLDRCGVTLPIQHSAPTQHRLGEAPDQHFHMDLQPRQAAPFGICLLRISQGSLEPLLPFANHTPLLGGLLIWKANSWPSGMTDCTARSPETSSADLEAAYYTEPPTGSAASASAYD